MTIQERQLLDRVEMLELKLRLLEGTMELMREWETAHIARHDESERYDNFLRSAAGDKFDKQFNHPLGQLDLITDSLRPKR